MIFVVNTRGLFIPLKVKKSITITTAFQNFLDESGCKTKKIWADKGTEFNNRSMKPWLEKNDVGVYSTNNEGIENMLLLKDLLEP